MALFQFTIPAGTMFGVNNSQTVVTADRGMSREVNQTVLVASFGDGYEQRVGDGINVKKDVFNLTFNNRPSSEANLIAAFFDTNAGKAFSFTVSDHASSTTTIKVVCDTYNVNYIRESIYSVSATFRRVYEP
jgi:phage-related protein